MHVRFGVGHFRLDRDHGSALYRANLVFDEEAFGRGYGEENDFCMRAANAGMLNVLCDDAYVVHHGGRSFGPLGLQPDPGSMQRLLALHPGYADLVSGFIQADPLAPLRGEVLRAMRRDGVSMG